MLKNSSRVFLLEVPYWRLGGGKKSCYPKKTRGR